MRSAYCSVLVLALALIAEPAVIAQPVGRGFPGLSEREQVEGSLADQTPSQNSTDFKIFVKGRQVGTEEVSVVRSATGTIISGRGRLSAPIDVEINQCEVRYDAEWHPVSASFDAIVRGQYMLLHTEFANGSATTRMAQAGQQANRTAKVNPSAVVLLNSYFSLYEALAIRLASLQPGAVIPLFFVPQAEVTAEFKSVSDEKIQAPGRTLAVKHYVLSVNEPNGANQLDLWADADHRLVHLSVAAQAFDMLRADVATVAARREVASRPGDEQVTFAGNGFTIAGTVSRPAAVITAKPGTVRAPAVVLVAGSGATDRDDYLFNVPIFGQVANALADAGYMVLRYDKRGVGQSGGRADAVTLDEYADDARSAVKYVRARKDVDGSRVIVAGYGEGGWAAMLASAGNKDISGLVLLATPGVTGAELVLAQQRHQLEAMRLTAVEQQARIDLQKKIESAVLSGTGWEGVPDQMRRQADTPWFRSFLLFDPAKVMRDIKQPILIVQGDVDRDVFAPQADKLAQMARARKGAAAAKVAVVHVPGVNHLLVPATTGEHDEYVRLADRNVSNDLLAALVKWLNEATKKSR